MAWRPEKNPGCVSSEQRKLSREAEASKGVGRLQAESQEGGKGEDLMVFLNGNETD